MIRRISVFLLFLLFLAGFFITCLPYINELVFQMQMKETVSDFQQIRDSQSPKSGLLNSSIVIPKAHKSKGKRGASGICAQTLVQVEMTFLLPGLTATGSGRIPRFQMNLTS